MAKPASAEPHPDRTDTCGARCCDECPDADFSQQSILPGKAADKAHGSRPDTASVRGLLTLGSERARHRFEARSVGKPWSATFPSSHGPHQGEVCLQATSCMPAVSGKTVPKLPHGCRPTAGSRQRAGTSSESLQWRPRKCSTNNSSASCPSRQRDSVHIAQTENHHFPGTRKRTCRHRHTAL